MSENLLATILTVVILVAIFAWVPLLNAVCPPCSRFLQRRRRRLTVGQPTVYAADSEAA
jgi:hypothetical protein